jgi:ABC-2 type transport system ATP-binding protein
MNDHAMLMQGVTKRFRDKYVLKELDLVIPKGSVFGLLGKNGAGKTTLIKCLLGLMRPQAGTISVLGDDPWNFKDTTKANVGYVPQTDRVYPWLTVRQLIDYTASFYPRWNQALVRRLLTEWELDERERVGVLSEGQAQKLLIILSLGHEPELLVFDEPVASLDPAARRQFLKTILEIVANRECTIFFSTHITSDLERVADRVALLKNSRIDFCGGLDELKDEVKRLRLTTPRGEFANLYFEGLIHCEKTAEGAIISVRGFNEELKWKLENTYNARVEVEDLNLEEIFLEMNR